MLPINAQAQIPANDDSPAGARLLAAGCVSCHGSEGQPPTGGLPLAGLKEADFTSRMHEFQSGQRPATVMHQIAKGYGEPQIAILARYFAAQRRAGDPQ
ncbi:MAG: c-type cytochrome [Ideonella sp.]